MASYQAVSGPPQAKASAPMIGSGVHGTAPPAGAFDEPPVASSPFAAPERENRRQCRLCLDDGSYNLNASNTLIAPCKCSGTNKWVHRECLDTWRSVSPRESSFFECDQCQTAYVLDHVGEEGAKAAKVKFCCLVFRDLFGVFLLVNALFFALGGIIEFLFQPDEAIINNFSFTDALTRHLSERATHVLLLYSCGGLFFLFLLGVGGIIYGLKICMQSMCGGDSGTSSSKEISPRDYPYRRNRYNPYGDCYFIYCYTPYYSDPVTSCYCCYCCNGGRTWGRTYRPHHHHYGGGNLCNGCQPGPNSGGSGCDGCGGCSGGGGHHGGGGCSGGGGHHGGGGCNCPSGGGGGGGGGNNDGGALGVIAAILLIIVIVIILIGLVVALVLLSAVVTRVVQRHLVVLEKKQKSRVFVVRDLSGVEAPPTYGGETSSLVGNAGANPYVV